MNTDSQEIKSNPTPDEGTQALEELLDSAKLTTEEKIRIQEARNKERQEHIETTRQQKALKLSEKQLEDFKSGNLDISHFSSYSLQILIANNFGGKNKELLNILKNWSLDSKIGSYLLSIVDITKDPLFKKLSAKYISLQIQKRAKKITISGKNYLTISKRNFSGNEKKLFETRLGREFLNYSDKIFKAKIVEDFKQKETKIQKDLKELDRSSKIEIYVLRQRHFRNAMAIHEPTAEIMKIQRRTLEKKYEVEKTFAKEYIKTTILLSDNPKTLSSKVERQAYWNIDYRNWNGSKTNPNVDDILRDGFAKQFEDNLKKMWEDFQKDPLVGIFDIGKIIGAGAIAGAATILSGGNPLVGGLAFTASDNAIGYVGHGVIGAARGESFIESGNKAIGLYQLDEEGNILKENGKPVFKKGEVIAVEKFGEVAMGIILMGPISKVGGKVTENLAIKGYNVVVSKGVGIGAEALVFNSLNVPFNPIISGASTIADTGDLQKGTQTFEATLEHSLSPANFLSSYVHNVAFIGSLRVGNKLGGEFIAKKFQSKAIETRYNSLTRSYESGIQDLNTEMQKLGFGVIKEGTGYKLVDSNGKPIEAIPESIQTKQKELDKMIMEIIGLSSALTSIKEKKEGEKEKGKGFMDAVKESYKGSFLASEKGSVSVDLLTLGGAGVVEGMMGIKDIELHSIKDKIRDDIGGELGKEIYEKIIGCTTMEEIVKNLSFEVNVNNKLQLINQILLLKFDIEKYSMRFAQIVRSQPQVFENLLNKAEVGTISNSVAEKLIKSDYGAYFIEKYIDKFTLLSNSVHLEIMTQRGIKYLEKVSNGNSILSSLQEQYIKNYSDILLKNANNDDFNGLGRLDYERNMFKNLSPELANLLLKNTGWFIGLDADNFISFNKETVNICINQKSEGILFIFNNIEKFIGLDKETAVKLMELGYSKEIIKHIDRFTGIDREVIDLLKSKGENVDEIAAKTGIYKYNLDINSNSYGNINRGTEAFFSKFTPRKFTPNYKFTDLFNIPDLHEGREKDGNAEIPKGYFEYKEHFEREYERFNNEIQNVAFNITDSIEGINYENLFYDIAEKGIRENLSEQDVIWEIEMKKNQIEGYVFDQIQRFSELLTNINFDSDGKWITSSLFNIINELSRELNNWNIRFDFDRVYRNLESIDRILYYNVEAIDNFNYDVENYNNNYSNRRIELLNETKDIPGEITNELTNSELGVLIQLKSNPNFDYKLLMDKDLMLSGFLNNMKMLLDDSNYVNLSKNELKLHILEYYTKSKINLLRHEIYKIHEDFFVNNNLGWTKIIQLLDINNRYYIGNESKKEMLDYKKYSDNLILDVFEGFEKGIYNIGSLDEIFSKASKLPFSYKVELLSKIMEFLGKSNLIDKDFEKYSGNPKILLEKLQNKSNIDYQGDVKIMKQGGVMIFIIESEADYYKFGGENTFGQHTSGSKNQYDYILINNSIAKKQGKDIDTCIHEIRHNKNKYLIDNFDKENDSRINESDSRRSKLKVYEEDYKDEIIAHINEGISSDEIIRLLESGYKKHLENIFKYSNLNQNQKNVYTYEKVTLAFMIKEFYPDYINLLTITPLSKWHKLIDKLAPKVNLSSEFPISYENILKIKDAEKRKNYLGFYKTWQEGLELYAKKYLYAQMTRLEYIDKSWLLY